MEVLDDGAAGRKPNLNQQGKSMTDHKVTIGSINSGVISDLMGDEIADIFYSDPPWGQGNISYWNTLLKRMTGETNTQQTYQDFLKRFFQIELKYSKNVVMVEYGLKWSDEVVSIALSQGLLFAGKVEYLYRSGSRMLPSMFHVFSKHALDIPHGYFERLHHKTGIEFMTLAVMPFYVPNGIILDPCCGLGLSARLALRLNMRFRGNEINRVRAEKTISLLS